MLWANANKNLLGFLKYPSINHFLTFNISYLISLYVYILLIVLNKRRSDYEKRLP